MTRVILGILTFLLVSANAQAENVIVFVNTLQDDGRTTGDPALYEELQRGKLEKQFPYSEFVVVRAATNRDLREGLARLVTDSTTIDALFVHSHGKSREAPPLASSFIGSFISNARAENGVQVELVRSGEVYDASQPNLESVARTFKPLIGKFGRGAKIVFDGCSLIAAGSNQAKTAAMLNVADNFGLSEGSLYMNSERGTSMKDVFMLQPFADQKTVEDQSLHLGFQVLAPVSYPVGLLIDAYFANQGYRLIVNRTKRVVGRLFHDDFENAMENPRPSGDLACVIVGRTTACSKR